MFPRFPAEAVANTLAALTAEQRQAVAALNEAVKDLQYPAVREREREREEIIVKSTVPSHFLSVTRSTARYARRTAAAAAGSRPTTRRC